VGLPLGGAAVGLFGPVITVPADACSHLLSAAGITAVRRREAPRRGPMADRRVAELLDGSRHILTHPGLRALHANHLLVAGLITAPEPLPAAASSCRG
jgi:hypothetical protein